MRVFLKIIFLFFILPVAAFSQDSSVYVVPGISPVSPMLHLQRTFVFIDVTQNFWLDKPDDITTKWISGGFNFNIAYEIHLVKNIFSLAPGIGFSNSTVKSNGYFNYEWLNDDPRGYTNLVPFSDSIDYKKNKFSASYIDLPVELRFRIRPNERGKNFWIAPGFRVGFLVSDFWKFKQNTGGGYVVKLKNYNIFHVRPEHYGLSLRFGYYKFGFYAFYSLSDLF